MNGRLAPADLQQIRLAFAGDQRIHHGVDLRQAALAGATGR